jgi:hypothetical protein
MFDGKSIADWITENVLVVVILVVGIGVIMKANTGETRKAVTAAGITLLGLLLVGAATHATDISGWLYGLIS